jgi:metacaspase-1
MTTKKALLIGINYIGTNSQLNGCINDVIHIKNYLINDCGFEEKNITMLTETSKNKSPTRENIIKHMHLLVKDNDENSRLYLHYSGHGSYVKDTNQDEIDQRDEVLCPLDYSTNGMIIDDDLKKILVDPLKEGAKLTAIVDSCHSGTILDLQVNYKIDTNDKRDRYTIDVDNHYKASKGNVMLLSGCLDNQTSADAYEEGKYQGAMTFSFLQTVNKLKAKNKTLTIQRMMKNILIFIKQRGYEQIPQISTGKLINLNSKFDIC